VSVKSPLRHQTYFGVVMIFKPIKLISIVILLAFDLSANAICTKQEQKMWDDMRFRQKLQGGDDTLSLLGDPCNKPKLSAKEKEVIDAKDKEPTPTRPRTNNKDDPINLDPAIFKQYYGYDKPTGPVDTWPVDIRRRLGLD